MSDDSAAPGIRKLRGPRRGPPIMALPLRKSKPFGHSFQISPRIGANVLSQGDEIHDLPSRIAIVGGVPARSLAAQFEG
jgi:hypothetical protein